MMFIQKGLPPQLIDSASRLFLSAFAEKLIPILGNDSKTIKLITSSISCESCFSALENNKLLGLLAIQTENQNFLNPNFKDLITLYGFWNGIAKSLRLYLLKHKSKPNELHVEGIAVFTFAQGKGIGTKLFKELISFAQNKNFKKLTLDVVDTNQRAVQLYQGLGFTIKKHSKIWPINKIVGWPFNEIILMHKTIA